LSFSSGQSKTCLRSLAFFLVSLPTDAKRSCGFATNRSRRSLLHQPGSSAVLSKRRSVLTQTSPWKTFLTITANGVVRFCPPIPSTKLVEWVDPVHDMGIFAAGKL
jgi:hypothetical protein